MVDLNKEALPQRYNIYVWKGDYVEVPLYFTDDNSLPEDLTSYTGKADIVQNGNVIVSFDVSIDANDGVATLMLESTDSATLMPGIYKYDFQLVQDITNRVRTYIYGAVVVRGENTVGI